MHTVSTSGTATRCLPPPSPASFLPHMYSAPQNTSSSTQRQMCMEAPQTPQRTFPASRSGCSSLILSVAARASLRLATLSSCSRCSLSKSPGSTRGSCAPSTTSHSSGEFFSCGMPR